MDSSPTADANPASAIAAVGGKRIVLVDDDADVRSRLRAAYEHNGARVTEAAGGEDGVRRVYGERPDLVVLDVELRDPDGWQVLARIRDASDVPVLVLSRLCSELEKVRALRAGADDHVSKPFGLPEVLARSEALLRRRRVRNDREARYCDPVLTVDFEAADARIQGESLGLTPQEYRLLTAFVRHPEAVLTKEQLLDLAWGDANLPTERVTLYVAYLRAKFRKAGAGAAAIETVQGMGYRYRPPQSLDGQ